MSKKSAADIIDRIQSEPTSAHSQMLSSLLSVAVAQIEQREFGLAKIALLRAQSIANELGIEQVKSQAQFHAARAFYLASGGGDLDCSLPIEIAAAQKHDPDNGLLKQVQTLMS